MILITACKRTHRETFSMNSLLSCLKFNVGKVLKLKKFSTNFNILFLIFFYYFFSQTELSHNLQQLSEKAKTGTEFIQRLKSQTEKVNVSPFILSLNLITCSWLRLFFPLFFCCFFNKKKRMCKCNNIYCLSFSSTMPEGQGKKLVSYSFLSFSFIFSGCSSQSILCSMWISKISQETTEWIDWLIFDPGSFCVLPFLLFSSFLS